MNAPNPLAEEQRLSVLRSLEILDTPPEERFDRIVRIAQAFFDVPIVLISLVDGQRQWFKSKVGLEAKQTARDISFCGHAVAENGLFEIFDAAADERFSTNPLVVDGPQIRFYAGQPLVVSDQAVGTLCLIDKQPRELDAQGRAMIRDLAALVEQQLAMVDVARANKGLEEARSDLAAFVENAHELVQYVDADGKILYTNRRWKEALGYHEKLPVNILEVVSLPKRDDVRSFLSSLSSTESAKNFETVFVTSGGRELVVSGNVRSVVRNGILQAQATLRDVTKERKQRRALKRRVRTDSLTELPNRFALEERFEIAQAHAKQCKQPLSIAMLDLDHFKSINDTHGHAAGDQVLRDFSSFLKAGLRKVDFAARYGGEEFCLLLPQTSETAAASLMNRLRLGLAEGDVGIEKKKDVTVSVGVTEVRADDSLEDALERADEALYAAKDGGRDRVELANA